MNRAVCKGFPYQSGGWQQAVSGRRVPRIKPRTRLFPQNFDQEFERILPVSPPERKIGVGWGADRYPGRALPDSGRRRRQPHNLCLSPIQRNLRTPQTGEPAYPTGKLGNTPFEVMPLGGTDSPSATTAPAIANQPVAELVPYPPR